MNNCRSCMATKCFDAEVKRIESFSALIERICESGTYLRVMPDEVLWVVPGFDTVVQVESNLMRWNVLLNQNE